MIIADSETFNWVSSTTLGVRILLLLIEIILVAIFSFKAVNIFNRLSDELAKSEIDRKRAEEDRTLTHQLLTVIKGWTVVFQQDKAHEKKEIKEVVIAAAKDAANTVKDAVKKAEETIPVQVVSQLTEKGTGLSKSGD